MERQALLTASYLDIIFDNRNKQYGGYELRTHYTHRIRNALLVVLGSCITLSVIMSIHKKATGSDRHVIVETTPTIFNPPPPIHKIEIPKPASPPAQPHANTVTFRPPTVVDDHDIIDKPAPTTTQLNTSTPGPTTSTGTSLDPNAISAPTSTTNVTTTNTDNKPAIWVEQMPEFNGNIQSYIGSNIHYPEIARENNIEGRVTIQFVVNEDGTVSNAKILKSIGGGCDEEALRIVNSMPKWKPGKQNGRPVKVFFTLPINFVLK